MRVNIPLLFLTLTFWSIISQTLAFSDNFCENICYFTPWLCSVCTSVHGSDFETRAEKEVKVKLMPITKGQLIQKAKAAHSRRTKIVGGTPVQQGESPWTVSIKHREGRDFYTFCGGSLISTKHIVTAAHCVQYHQPYELFVGVGDWDKEVQEYGEILSAVVKIQMHPDYNPFTFEADLAVVELAQTIDFDQYKQPIALAQSDTFLNESIMFNVTGWGTLRKKGQSSQRLRRVTLPFVPDEKCKNIYNILRLTTVKVKEGMICAGWAQGGHDACHGDSGGPLVTNLPGNFHVLKMSEVEQRGRNIHLRELLHPEEDSITSRDELFNNFDGGDVLENRMFWLSGDNETQQMVGDGLQAAISALVALHNFQQNSHHMLLSNLTDQPLIAQLGIPGALLALLSPPKHQQNTPVFSPLEPEHFEPNRQTGIPTLVGVVSWGLGCAKPDFPGVYTDIRVYRNWIIDIIGGEPQWIYIQ